VRCRFYWIELAAAAFWDRQVSAEEWEAGFLSGHRSYLPQTFSYIHPKHALKILDRAEFIREWPALRLLVLSEYPHLARKIPMWDGYWSLAAAGVMDVKPLQKWFSLPKRAREFLLWVCRHPGTSIYAAAKGLNMAYKRAFEHAKQLSGAGF
jgi:hypothetical protein